MMFFCRKPLAKRTEIWFIRAEANGIGHRLLFEFMDPARKILMILLLGVSLAGLAGCATSDSDLGYSRKTIDDSSGDSSYHGWAAPPKEKDASQTSQ